MTNKKSSLNSEVAIATKNANAGGHKADSKVTTYEALAKCHEALPRTESGEVIINCQQLHDLAASRKYLLKCECTGKSTHLHITEKVSNYGSGAYTVLTGTANGERFELLTISELKKLLGCEYVRPTASKAFTSRAVRTLSQLEEEARKENEKELADLIQKAKVFAQAREKARLEEEKKAKEKADAENKKGKETDKAVEMLRKQGIPEEVIQMYLACRK